MKVIYPETETHPLHHQYDGDFEPLPAYVEIDPEDDELSVGIGQEECTPIYVWLGKSYRVSVSAELTHDGLVALMDEIKPLAEKVAEGHSTEWDGSNIVGKLDACAEKALLKIEKIAMTGRLPAAACGTLATISTGSTRRKSPPKPPTRKSPK